MPAEGSAVSGMGTYSDQIFSTPLSADDIASIDFPYLSDLPHKFLCPGRKNPDPFSSLLRPSKVHLQYPQFPLLSNQIIGSIWNGVQEVTDWRKPEIHKRGHHTRSININIIATSYMRPTTTVKQIKGSGTRIVDATKNPGAPTDKVSRRCARGRYIGGSDFTGVRSITANPSWTDLYGK